MPVAITGTAACSDGATGAASSGAGRPLVPSRGECTKSPDVVTDQRLSQALS